MASLTYHAPSLEALAPARHAELLQEFLAILDAKGMASMDQYGDMLSWDLPSKEGFCRYFHVFDPGFCSFSDQFSGTTHYHGGEIRGSILLGSVTHLTYQPTFSMDGDRKHGEERLFLERFDHGHPEGTRYALPAWTPHWVVPRELTLTYFEEKDNGEMGDLLDRVDTPGHDTHHFEQEDADALVPVLRAKIQRRLESRTITPSMRS